MTTTCPLMLSHHDDNGDTSQQIVLDWNCIENLSDKREKKQRLVDAFRRACLNDGAAVATEEQHQQQQPSNHRHQPPHHRELVLIKGPSGVGKSGLAQTLDYETKQHGGYFCRGKFDQPRRIAEAIMSDNNSDSYSPFVTAISELAHAIAKKEQNSLENVREAIECELDGSELLVLEESIPALRKITKSSSSSSTSSSSTSSKTAAATTLSSSSSANPSDSQQQPHWHGLKGLEAEKRYLHIICKLVKALSSPHRPIVMLIDDLQWADRNAMQLIKLLVQDVTTGLLVVGTVRFSEVLPDGPLMMLLTEWNKKKKSNENDNDDDDDDADKDNDDDAVVVTVTEIELGDLTETDVNELVANVLKLSLQESKTLSKVVYHQTHGNLFFVVHFLSVLNREGLLYLNSNGKCSWDRDEIANAFAGDLTVIDFLAVKISELTVYEQQVLKIASCLGGTIYECLLLETITPSTGVRAALLTAAKQELISFDTETGKGRFVHDRIQEAAYTLILPSDRAKMHLDIGLRLWTWLKTEERETHLFTVANQIIRGVHLFDDPIEKAELATLMLRAGEKASLQSSFSAAASYFEVGISLLRKKPWKNQYRMCLSLYNAAAEVEYYNGNLDRLDSLLKEIFSHAHSLDHKLRAHFTEIYSLYSRDEMKLAFAKGMGVLQQLGEKFPRKVGKLEIAFAWSRCKRLLSGKTDDAIMKLPLMTDIRKQVIMRLLTLLITGAFVTQQSYFPLIVTRMIEHTIRHGISAMSCYAFAIVGYCYGRRGQVDEEYRFGRLAIRVMNKFHSTEWQCRVAVALTYCLKNKISDQIKPLQSAHRAGLVAGDVHFSMVCASFQCRLSFFASEPLADVAKVVDDYRKLCNQYGQQSVSVMLTHQLQLCFNFMGRSSDPLILSGEVMNEEETIAALEQKHPVSLAWLLLMKHMLAVYFNNIQEASAVAKTIRKMNTESTILPCVLQNHLFLEGLSAATHARVDKSQMRRARRILEKLRSVTSTPYSFFENKVKLVEAELMGASRGDRNKVLMKYAQSIESARQQGFLHEQALACEKAGMVLLEWNEPEQAREFLNDAKSLYQQWGAEAKVRHIERHME